VSPKKALNFVMMTEGLAGCAGRSWSTWKL